jgi:4'-phosphopantetheinyl transferase
MKGDAIEEFRLPDPTPAAPVEGKIHLWWVDLPAAEGRAAARAALRTILAGYLGEPEPDLAPGPNGKPGLAKAAERLSFNLSHSGGLALVAVVPGDAEVGVDVERLRPRRDLARLARRWLPADDAAAVAAAPAAEREAAFYAAWTRHEARVKCTGAGLAGPAPGPEVEALQLDAGDGYAAAVAVRAGRGRG